MSTKGVYGFRVGNTDKLALASAAADPNFLGKRVLNYIAIHNFNFLLNQARELRLVEDTNLEENPLTPLEQIFKLGIVDNSEFIRETGCEWAYVINVDSRKLEVHRGSPLKNYAPKGRYLLSSNPPHYTGAVLVEEIPLEIIRPESVDYLIKTLIVANDNLYQI